MKELFSTTSDPELVRPLVRGESEVMLQIMLAEREGLIKPLKADALFKNMAGGVPAILKIMLGRLELTDLEYDEGVIILLAGLSMGIPGRAVMLAHALVKATRARGKAIDINYLASELCPWGFPTDKVFKEVWESQKLGSKNYLDTHEAWQ